MVKDKDQKALWANAAGRCSMPECRVKLTLIKEEASGAITFGEMCHIVGEKNNDKSPRGISKLPVENRNEYSNLLLLCAHHHRTIDKDVDSWPIELLHKIKVDHEFWVDETLNAKKQLPNEIIYSDLIDSILIGLKLDSWNWFIDHGVRQILHSKYIDGGDIIQRKLLTTEWPSENEELESAIKSVMDAYLSYINQYLEVAVPGERMLDYYSADVSYKRIYPNAKYDYYAKRNDIWARLNFVLLCKYVIELNKFLKSVRKHHNPYFLLKTGKFIIEDHLGVHLGDFGAIIEPESISDLDNRIEVLNNEMLELKKEYAS